MIYQDYEEEFYSDYGYYPTLTDYIRDAGIQAGLTMYFNYKYPDSNAPVVVLMLSLFLAPVLLVVFAIPLIIFFAVLGVLKMK